MPESIRQGQNPHKVLWKEAAVASAKNALTRKPAATAEGAIQLNIEKEALGGSRDEGRAWRRCLFGRVQAPSEQSFDQRPEATEACNQKV